MTESAIKYYLQTLETKDDRDYLDKWMSVQNRNYWRYHNPQKEKSAK